MLGKPWPSLLLTYATYVLAAAIMELIGQFCLGLWRYPAYGLRENLIHVLLIGYPFCFFFLFELYNLLRRVIAFWPVAMELTALVGCFASEIPNLRALEWIYTVPHISATILGINLAVVIGWVALVAVPLVVDKVICLTADLSPGSTDSAEQVLAK